MCLSTLIDTVSSAVVHSWDLKLQRAYAQKAAGIVGAIKFCYRYQMHMQHERLQMRVNQAT